MITVDHHLRALAAFDLRVEAIGDGQWGSPVPSCPGWDVEDLVSHVTVRTAWLARMLAGDGPDVAAAFVRRVCGGAGGPVPAWRRVHLHARAVLDQTTLDGDVQLPTGSTSARSYLAETCCGTVVHTWDLATAIGADPTLDSILVATVAEWFDGIEETWRERGLIGPAVQVPAGADGADAQRALLARFGRA